MAGQGKGVLRIAIEDFFTTTKIGKWIAGWFIDFGEAQEQAIHDSFVNLIPNIKDWATDPQKVLPKAPKQDGTGHQGEIMGALGFASQVGMSAASGLLAPLMRLLNYSMDKDLHTARFDPPLVANLYFRNKPLGQQYINDLTELGWRDDRVNAWMEALKPLLAVGDIVTMYHRKLFTEDQARTEITKQGFSITQAVNFIEMGKLIPGVSDLISIAVREGFSPSIIKKFQYDEAYPTEIDEYLEMQGLNKEWGMRYWAAHWNLPSLTQAFEMYHRLRPGRTSPTFTDDDLDLLMRTADIAPYFRPRLKQIAFNPYTRVDLRRMYKAGIIDEAEVQATYQDLGYDAKHAKNLTDFTIAWAEGSDGSVVDNQASLTEGLLSNMFNKNIIDEATFRSELAKLEYAPTYIEWLVKYTISKRTVDTTPDEYNTYQSKMKSQVVAAYTARQITVLEAHQALEAAGYTATAVDYLLQAADYDYLQGTRNEIIKLIADSYLSKLMDRTQVVQELGKINVSGAEQTQLLNEWDNALFYRNKRLSVSDYTNALQLGIISQDKYVEYLQGAGYADQDITIKLALYQAAATADQANEVALQQKAEQTAAKKVSVTDLLDAYAKGAISETELYDRLQTAGYTTDDISLLISTKYNAPAPTLSKLTVTQIMTALKRGVLTEDDVMSMLTARGYTNGDINIILASQSTGA
jgi:hypothetical protein